MRDLVSDICNSDHGQRKCREKIVTSGRKQPRKRVPSEQQPDAGERNDAKDYRDGPMGPVETNVHRPLLIAPQKESVKAEPSGLRKAGRANAPAVLPLTTKCFRIHMNAKADRSLAQDKRLRTSGFNSESGAHLYIARMPVKEKP